MIEQQSKDQSTSHDEIELRELFGILWRGKWIILVITFLFAIGSVRHALTSPNIYAAEATLAPADDNQGGSNLGSMGGQFGGLANLAGIQVGQGSISDAMMALEIMKSRKFIANFVERRGIQPDLLAVKSWNERTGDIVYNEAIYNPDSQSWVREVEPPAEATPNNWELVRAFRNHLIVEEDDELPLITLKIEHRSPIVAKQWVDWLIEDINNEMRKRDIEEAQRSIDFISREMTNAQLRSTEQIYSGLMEQQTQTIMLANVRPEYIYTVVDPAVVPEQRERPRRTLIVIIGSLLGGFLSLLVVLITYLFRNAK